MNELILSERMPVLAMRGLVLFPQATMHFDVGREKSVRALEAAMNADQHIFLVTQKAIEQDDPGFGDLYEIGTVAHVLQVLKIPGDTVRVLVQGEYRARATQMLQTAPCMRCGLRTPAASRPGWRSFPSTSFWAAACGI